jgi:uncharacterized protein (UPF0332 family)
MPIEKAHELLRAAELCFAETLYNSTANRAYYAMFQAAVVALEKTGLRPQGDQWSHAAVHALFASEFIHHRKLFPRRVGHYLPDGLAVRHQADYDERSLSQNQARRVLAWAREFLQLVAGQ